MGPSGVEKEPPVSSTDDASSSSVESGFDEENQDSNINESKSSLRYSTREEQEVAKALAAQAFHLPGNESYWEDLRQYLGNNHPLFGICFHHSLHPAGWGARMLCLTASVVFGLVLTNIVWLWAHSQQETLSFTLDVGHTIGDGVNNNVTAAYTKYLLDVDERNQVHVTADMIFLWTVGGAIHGLFDNVIWTCTVCACCSFQRLDKYQRYGTGIVTFIILVVTAIATLTVVMRLALEDSDETETNIADMQSAGLWDDEVNLNTLTKVTNRGQYKEFLLSCAVELVIALFFHYPVVAWFLFSGILSCGGRIPRFGGWAEELRRLAEQQDGEADSGTDKVSKEQHSNRNDDENSHGGNDEYDDTVSRTSKTQCSV